MYTTAASALETMSGLLHFLQNIVNVGPQTAKNSTEVFIHCP